MKKTAKKNKVKKAKTILKEEIPFNQFFDICIRKGIFKEEERQGIENSFIRRGLRSKEDIKIFEAVLKNY